MNRQMLPLLYIGSDKSNCLRKITLNEKACAISNFSSDSNGSNIHIVIIHIYKNTDSNLNDDPCTVNWITTLEIVYSIVPYYPFKLVSWILNHSAYV